MDSTHISSESILEKEMASEDCHVLVIWIQQFVDALTVCTYGLYFHFMLGFLLHIDGKINNCNIFSLPLQERKQIWNMA